MQPYTDWYRADTSKAVGETNYLSLYLLYLATNIRFSSLKKQNTL